jgi:hypothetical protein
MTVRILSLNGIKKNFNKNDLAENCDDGDFGLEKVLKPWIDI